MAKSKKWIVRAGLLGSALFLHNQQLNKIARKTDRLTAQAVDELNAAHPGLNADCYFIDTGEVILHTLVAGPTDGPLAVLLHGFPEHWVSWRKQIPALAQAGYRVVVPDQRGYNRSSKPWGIRPYRLDALTKDVAGLIEKLGGETAVIIAHDWGGGVGWQFAADYPQMTDKLIILNAPHPKAMGRELRKGWEQRLKSWYMLFFQLPVLPELLFTLNPYQTARQSFQQMTAQPGAFSDDEVEMMAVAMSQPWAMTSMINWYAPFATSLPAKPTSSPHPRCSSGVSKILPSAAPSPKIWKSGCPTSSAITCQPATTGCKTKPPKKSTRRCSAF